MNTETVLDELRRKAEEDVPEYNETMYFENIGDEVVGFLHDVRHNIGQYNKTVYTIEQMDGTQIDVFGTTVLDGLMADVKIGEPVLIRYLGMATSQNGRNQYHKFKVIR
ncbi:MAG: hypothetical protein OCU12_08025 [Methanophagales archaeon]|nr:hypothetical protein [Methanophagales archaeon]